MEARTVRGYGPDGSRSGAGAGSLLDGLDDLRLEAGWSVRAQGRRSLLAAPGSHSREGSHQGGEVLGSVGHPRHF
jgi:hypothetical protein